MGLSKDKGTTLAGGEGGNKNRCFLQTAKRLFKKRDVYKKRGLHARQFAEVINLFGPNKQLVVDGCKPMLDQGLVVEVSEQKEG